MSQEINIVCSDGVIPVEKSWLEYNSLYFKNSVEWETVQSAISLSDNSFTKEEVETALAIFRGDTVLFGERCGRKWAVKIRRDILLGALTFLDKYIFDRETILQVFLDYFSEESQKYFWFSFLRSFFRENPNSYSKEMIVRCGERIESFLLDKINSLEEKVRKQDADIGILRYGCVRGDGGYPGNAGSLGVRGRAF